MAPYGIGVPSGGDQVTGEGEPSMGEITIVGLDLAKQVFQVHAV